MGCPKGLLRTDGGQTLVARWSALLAELGIEHVLVGVRSEYAALGLPAIPDAPPGIGPLGGLAALLTAAGERRALALACDMPFVTRADLEALLAAPSAPVVAPRRNGRWEPLCARYDAPRVLPLVERRIVATEHALQALLDEAGAEPVLLADTHLHDWDSPDDLPGG